MMKEETEYRAMQVLEERPDVSRRALASELGVSLGKAHYCVKALLDKGWVTAIPHKSSHERGGYHYVLTRLGKQQKALLTVRFMVSKRREYEGLCAEFEKLQRDGCRSMGQSCQDDGATDGE